MRRLPPATRTLLITSLGLPGMPELLLAQEADPEGVSYRYNHYDENPLPGELLADGSPDRYTIDSHQLRVVEQLDGQWTLVVDALHETMSGSSPWFVLPDPTLGAVQVMSGATIREQREEIVAAFTRLDEDVSHSFGAGWSTEDDYDAKSLFYTGELERGHTTWSWGLSHSDDRLSPSDAAEFGRVAHADKRSTSVSAGWTRVLNRDALLQTGVQWTRQSGYLSDPYKQVLVGGLLEFDLRPDARRLFAWTTRLRQYFEGSEGALHADYRYFRDDWEIESHTLDLAWHQPLGSGWEIAPSVRYYSQEAAEFYGPVFDTVPGEEAWSSDFRLSTYGALAWRLALTWRGAQWTATASAETYDSDRSLAISGSGPEAPGLVDFERFALGIERRW